MTSKSDLTTFCLEVARQLDIRYKSPPLPVDLTTMGTAANALEALKFQDRSLDQAKITEALNANVPPNRGVRGQHEAFGGG